MRYFEDILSLQVKNIRNLVNEAKETQITITVASTPVIERFVERLESILSYVKKFELYHIFMPGEICRYKVLSDLEYLKNHIETKYTYREGTFAYKTMNSILDVINETMEEIK